MNNLNDLNDIVWLNGFLGVRGLPEEEARSIYEAADDGGIIQPYQMVRLGYINPCHHTTCTIEQALEWAGGEVVEE